MTEAAPTPFFGNWEIVLNRGKLEVVTDPETGGPVKTGRYVQVPRTETQWGEWQIDVYDGPDGAGYVQVLRTTQNGITYQKAINYGPEEWRTHDWAEVGS